MPIDLFIYIVIAVVLVIWLRNTIGSKHGSETDRSDILEQIKERQRQADELKERGRTVDLTLLKPSSLDQTESRTQIETLPIEGGEDTMKEISDYIKSDSGFDPQTFINGAKEAFPMIVEAFAREDLRTLKMLLSEGVYASFEQAIDDRKAAGETLATDVHIIKDCKIMGIKRIDRMIYIKLRFIAEETIVIRNREGQIIHGNPDKLVTMNDVWTFGRDVRSKDPTWYLYETSDDVAEELQNPIPDSK
ncbi:MAG: Tim44 domain-containing protein [Alphaproteobacteria bacterium]|nr:Tim44 domain-containing protein [Alphaproteobacteria bacterium]